MTLRAELQAVIGKLLGGLAVSETKRVALNDVAAALGTVAISAAEVDAVFRRLEQAGVEVIAAPTPSLLPLLGRVLKVARDGKAESRSVTSRDIALELGIDEHEVRAALLFARTFG